MAVCSHTDATKTELTCPLLEGGDTDVSITVTAEDGKTSVYNITAHRDPSTDSSLANFTTTAGWESTLSFDPNVLEYKWTVENHVTNMAVLADINHYGATLRINNVLQTSGVVSPTINLLENGNTETSAFIIAQDDVTHRTYKLTVARDPSHDALLTGLHPVPKTLLAEDPGNLYLSPAFYSYNGSYTLSVPWTVSTLGFQLDTAHPEATITVEKRTHTTASPSAPVALLEGGSVTITIQVALILILTLTLTLTMILILILCFVTVQVTAQDGYTIKDYTVIVTRDPSPIATLSNLQSNIISLGSDLTPTFLPDITKYALAVTYSIQAVTLTPTTTSDHATVTVNGVSLESGATSGSLSIASGDNNIDKGESPPQAHPAITVTATVEILLAS